MKKSRAILEIAVALFVLIAAVITRFPFTFFHSQIGGYLFVYGTIISALVMLAIGATRLSKFSTIETLTLNSKISVVSDALVMAMAFAVLYFEMLPTNRQWVYLFLGVGLLSYAVGQIILGVFAQDVRLGLRVVTTAIGIVVWALSIVVIFFPLVLIHSTVNGGSAMRVYLPYNYFSGIALILIGVDFLISAIFGVLLTSKSRALRQEGFT
jgi:hypothetical protein